jgi:putative intracellular protease/amidase
MDTNTYPRQGFASILIAPGFDEEAVVPCLCQMRQGGTAVILAGVPAGLVTGVSGLTVRPDCPLAQLPIHDCRLLVIPGKRDCAAHLLSDPRVHRTIEATLANGGLVAAMSPVVEQVLFGVGLLTETTYDQFLAQGNQKTKRFVQALIARIVV